MGPALLAIGAACVGAPSGWTHHDVGGLVVPRATWSPPVPWAPPPYTALCRLSSRNYNPTVRMEALAPLPPPSEQPLGVRVDSALRGPLAVAVLMQTRRRGGS